MIIAVMKKSETNLKITALKEEFFYYNYHHFKIITFECILAKTFAKCIRNFKDMLLHNSDIYLLSRI